MKKIIPVLCFGLLLSGCASQIFQSNDPVMSIYSLRAASEPASAGRASKTSHIIDIQRPILPPGFDTARIAMYLDSGHRLDYYSAAQWTAPLDETIQEFTVQTVRKTIVNAIIAEVGQGDAEYRLQMRVNDFEPFYANGPDQAPQLIASITFTLVNLTEDKIVTSFTIDQQQVAQANNLGSITFDLGIILQSVESKALETIAPYLK